jgi:hypothetical protein
MNKMDKTFTLWVTDEQHEYLRRESFETRKIMSDIIRQLIDEKMKGDKKKGRRSNGQV